MQNEKNCENADVEQYKKALALMWYAYENKGTDPLVRSPIENEAVAGAEVLLGQLDSCVQQYLSKQIHAPLWCLHQIVEADSITCGAYSAKGSKHQCPYKSIANSTLAKQLCPYYHPLANKMRNKNVAV